MTRYDKEPLVDLFHNAAIRREAVAAATGTAVPPSKPKLPRWRQLLLQFEQSLGKLPWRLMGKSILVVIFLGAGYWAWQNQSWLNDKITTTIAEATGATVQKIEVTGLTHTPQAALLGALGLQRGSSLVGFDAAAARGQIEALPWVRLASVERQLPATVRVQIYEHTPLARIISGSAVWVLNPQGRPITTDDTNAFIGLPLLQGAGASEAMGQLFTMLQSKPNLLAQLREAIWVGNRRWDLRFISGVTVMLPEGRIPQGLSQLETLEQARHVLTLNDGVVDLRLTDRIILRLPAAVGVTPVTALKPSATEPVQAQ